MHILILGAGQIGTLYAKHFAQQGVSHTLSRVDITDMDALTEVVRNEHPDVVINTAAKTNLEWCTQNKEEAFRVNVLGAANVAQVCDMNQCYLIHFSSGCIFESKHADDIKTEESIPNPGSYYAWTKVWAENLIPFERSKNFSYVILRPRQPVSAHVNHKNMLVKMLTFQKFIDTPNGGTVLEDLLLWTDAIIAKRPQGILHVANDGWTTPYHIGELIKKYILPELPLEKITKEELDTMMPNRRVDTVMSVDRLKSLGIQVTHYEERLETLVADLGEHIRQADKGLLRTELEKTAELSKGRTQVNTVWRTLLD